MSGSDPPPRKRPRNNVEGEAGSESIIESKSDSLAISTQSESSQLPTILERSIFNISPINDIVKTVGDFLYEHVGKQNVEIEAKLGILVEKGSKNRINLPVLTDTVISMDHEKSQSIRFESNMTPAQHQQYNKLLNELVNNTSQSGYSGAKVNYKHTREIDLFYPNGNRSGRNNGKIRVTTDQKDGRTLAVVEKTRVADLNIFCPKLLLDYRISVNIEKPAEYPHGLTPKFERKKDRLSYTHQIFKIDLTQVKAPSGLDQPPEVSHELEIEFIDPRLLANEKEKLGGPYANQSRYLETIEVFLNNIRMLASKTRR